MKFPFPTRNSGLFLLFLLIFCAGAKAQPALWKVHEADGGKLKFSVWADTLYYIGPGLFTASLAKESFLFRDHPFHPLQRTPEKKFSALNRNFFGAKKGEFWQLFECKNPLEAMPGLYRQLQTWRGQTLAENENGWMLITDSGEEMAADSVSVFDDKLLLYQKSGVLWIDQNLKGRFYRTSGPDRKFNEPFFTFLRNDSSWIPLQGNHLLKERPGSFWWNDSCLLDSSSKEVWLQQPGKNRKRIGDSVSVVSPNLLWLKSGKQEFLLFAGRNRIPVKPHSERKQLNDSLCAIRTGTCWIFISGSGNRHPLKPVISEIGRCYGDWVLVKSGKRWGCTDLGGIIRISCRYDSLLPPTQGRMAVRIGPVWGFLDRDERIIIQPNFEIVQPFEDSLCLIRQAGRWGLLNFNGQMELACQYDKISNTAAGCRLIKKGLWLGLADHRGKILLNTRYSDIIEARSGCFRVERDGRSGLFSKDGNFLLSIEHSLILQDEIHGMLISR